MKLDYKVKGTTLEGSLSPFVDNSNVIRPFEIHDIQCKKLTLCNSNRILYTLGPRNSRFIGKKTKKNKTRN